MARFHILHNQEKMVALLIPTLTSISERWPYMKKPLTNLTSLLKQSSGLPPINPSYIPSSQHPPSSQKFPPIQHVPPSQIRSSSIAKKDPPESAVEFCDSESSPNLNQKPEVFLPSEKPHDMGCSMLDSSFMSMLNDISTFQEIDPSLGAESTWIA